MWISNLYPYLKNYKILELTPISNVLFNSFAMFNLPMEKENPFTSIFKLQTSPNFKLKVGEVLQCIVGSSVGDQSGFVI